jgi:hypothetical protein
MAQAMLHQIVQLLAPGCVPLFLSDGNPNYLPAIVTHFGHWVPLPRRQARGPTPLAEGPLVVTRQRHPVAWVALPSRAA